MNTVCQKLYTKRIAGALLLWISAAILIFFICTYIALVNKAVVHTALREDAVKETRELEQRVATQEASYAHISQSLSKDTALDSGFIDQPTTQFVTRVPASPSVTFNTVQ